MGPACLGDMITTAFSLKVVTASSGRARKQHRLKTYVKNPRKPVKTPKIARATAIVGIVHSSTEHKKPLPNSNLKSKVKIFLETINIPLVRIF
ncbi:hypothetical protein KAU55_06905 [Candidatus Bathyarchaeota archaeon]|nr:hypothetical protein [Candidatus Bathyarchaeota archaeon]